MRDFKFCEKSLHGTFLIFSTKLLQLKDLELTLNDFLEKSHALEFLDKSGQNGLLWK